MTDWSRLLLIIGNLPRHRHQLEVQAVQLLQRAIVQFLGKALALVFLAVQQPMLHLAQCSLV